MEVVGSQIFDEQEAKTSESTEGWMSIDKARGKIDSDMEAMRNQLQSDPSMRQKYIEELQSYGVDTSLLDDDMLVSELARQRMLAELNRTDYI